MTTQLAPRWYSSPDDCIWTGPDSKDRYAEAIENGATHLVREVSVRTSALTERPNAEQIWQLVSRAETEYTHLRGCNIEVPDIDWLVVEHEGRNRLVAHVEVIEGRRLASRDIDPKQLSWLGLIKHHKALRERAKFTRYRQARPPEVRLGDMGIWQAVRGTSRVYPTRKPRTYMVDPDIHFIS